VETEERFRVTVRGPVPGPVQNEFALARHWSDPANWRLGILYSAAADPRWFVPMRFTNAAWTPNLAHGRASALGAAMLAVSAGPLVAAAIVASLDERRFIAAAIVWFLVLNVPVGVYVRRDADD